MATPYTRGSTLMLSDGFGRAIGYPVHAGIDPTCHASSPCLRRLPRTRGDRPHHYEHGHVVTPATPYTRGSTLILVTQAKNLIGYPVHAGIDLHQEKDEKI